MFKIVLLILPYVVSGSVMALQTQRTDVIEDLPNVKSTYGNNTYDDEVLQLQFQTEDTEVKGPDDDSESMMFDELIQDTGIVKQKLQHSVDGVERRIKRTNLMPLMNSSIHLGTMNCTINDYCNIQELDWIPLVAYFKCNCHNSSHNFTFLYVQASLFGDYFDLVFTGLSSCHIDESELDEFEQLPCLQGTWDALYHVGINDTTDYSLDCFGIYSIVRSTCTSIESKGKRKLHVN